MNHIEFFLASKKDKNIVTFNINKIDLGRFVSYKGAALIVELIGNRQLIPVIFEINREGKTAATRSWPKALKAPTMTKRVKYEYNSISWFADHHRVVHQTAE